MLRDIYWAVGVVVLLTAEPKVVGSFQTTNTKYLCDDQEYVHILWLAGTVWKVQIYLKKKMTMNWTLLTFPEHNISIYIFW